MDRNRLLTIVTLLIELCLQLIFGLNLTVYQTSSYNNPDLSSEFTHFVVHNETGTVYIGASDALYQLTEDFMKQEMVDTSVDECEDDVPDCPNYNKILLIDETHNRLITCGSENMGTCKTRDLNDIRTVLMNGSDQSVVASEMLTAEGIIATGPGGALTLYVAATHEEQRGLSSPVSRRFLGTDANLIFAIDAGLQLLTTIPNLDTFLIRYVYVFLKNEFTFFVTHQRKFEENDFISKINRVCHDSENFDSFTEITLECQGQSGIVYNLIQAAYVGAAGPDLAASLNVGDEDEVFYGVFAKSQDVNGYVPSSQSALCVFKMQDIEAEFETAIAGCFGGGDDSYRINYLAGVEDCLFLPSLTEEQFRGQLCTAQNWRYASGVDPLQSVAVVEWSDVIPSSTITTTHRQHTVAFVGTTQGDIAKVHIINQTSGREYERFALGSHVLRDAEMDKDQEELTILTKQQLLKLKVENCSAYTTCGECIGVNGAQDGDPYCGWCTLERRCSLYDSCPMANETSRWLPYNTIQCVGISNVAPYDSIPITKPEQQIILTVEQLPEETSENSYQCIFDDNSPVTASKIGNKLYCTTPALSDIPEIQSGNDHVTMQLYVYSTETRIKFLQRDFYFYECNTHIGCVACTNSRWACDWCIYSNKCTHDNSTCSEDDSNSIINGRENPEMAPRQGPEECPQLDAQNGERLLPVGVSRSITVTGINLPDENRVDNYKCILEIDGKEIVTAANRQQNGRIITCTPKMYTYAMDDQHLDVSLNVVWNNNRKLDDVFGFKVTLFKCEVDRPDCSRCLSDVTTRAELMCGWCKTDNRCTVSSKCSGDWISSDTNENCPDPVLSGVWPPSGPPKGNTVISVTGLDLGQRFTDVISVFVGDTQCSTDGLFELYKPGSSVSCRTPPGSSDVTQSITVTINGADGSPQSSTGEIQFTYRDPSISSFEPMEGPAAGGTMVTITGQYLDACSNISATVGSECTMNRMNDVINATTARCRTTVSPVGSSHRLIVSFDELTEEQSPNEFTYKPNPTVSDVQPQKTIESGGITFDVSGTGFQLAQTPQIVIFIGDKEFKEDCEIRNDTMMQCKTPNVKSPSARRKRAALGEASFGFVIGDVTDLLSWSDDNNVTLEYFEDPVYYPLESNPREKTGDVETIMGENLDVASSEIDVTVYIGTEKAVTTSLAETVLTIELPKKNPGRDCINGSRTDYPCVIVRHGNLEFHVGTIRYPGSAGISAIVIGIAVACSILIIILVIVMISYQMKVRGHKEDIGKLVFEMKEMETNIAADIREAFVQLQTDVTDLTSDLEGTGMPFVPHRKYAISMFFAGLDTQPMTYDPEDSEESVERAMLELSKLLSNKQFLMAFIQTLDEDRSVPNKDRLTIASMLTVLMILEEKLPYLTDVMITLMASQVQDAIEEGKPNRLFQRTELIIEKLLSNWIALSLYDFLKDHAAYPLFLLYRAIKCQTEKGPIDMISGKSHISLNDDNIISQRLTFETITLNVIINDEDGEKKEVKVLDLDSVGQVKTKILDSIHRNRAYSSRMQPWQVDLEWRHGKSGHLVLLDVDVSSDLEPGWKRVNSMKHFNVPDGSNVALTLKQDVPNATVSGETATRYSNVRRSIARSSISMAPAVIAQVEEGVMLWHLVKDEGGDTTAAESERKKSKSRRKTVREKKQIREVTFPRLLGTKGTVQEYMDNMFAAILNTDDVPIGVKYIFDFFDGLAVRYNIEDEAVLHRWKSNILPLRFWQKIITNPQYIFDICQTQYVEASLSVISQAFYDAFQKNTPQISKDASYRKLLYNQEIPKYRIMVDEYYKSVSEMQRVTKSLLESDLKETCTKFTGLFSRLSTLLELHKMMTKYKSRLMEALEDDEIYERAGLPEKLEHVLSLLPSSTDGYDNPKYVYQQDVASDE